MPKQAYISISDVAWSAHGETPDFENLKKSTDGLPEDAKLKMTIFVFESDCLPEIADTELFQQPPFTVRAKDGFKPRVSLTINSSIDDPDFEQLKVTAILKSGKGTKGLDSFAIERALLRWLGSHVDTWVRYIRDTGMKILG